MQTQMPCHRCQITWHNPMPIILARWLTIGSAPLQTTLIHHTLPHDFSAFHNTFFLNFLPFPGTYGVLGDLGDLGDDSGLGVLLVTLCLLPPPIRAYSGGGDSSASSPSKLKDWNLWCAAFILAVPWELSPRIPAIARLAGESSGACSVYSGIGGASLPESK